MLPTYAWQYINLWTTKVFTKISMYASIRYKTRHFWALSTLLTPFSSHNILELSVHSEHLFPVTTFSRQIATFSRQSRDARRRCVAICRDLSREKTPIAKKKIFCFISFTSRFSSSCFSLSHTHISYKIIYYFCPNCHFRSATCPSNIALVIFAAFKSSFSVSVFPCNDLILVSYFFFLSFISSLLYCLPIIIVIF